MPKQCVQITLDLHMLSRGLEEDFKQQLTAAIQDCRQRPSLAKPRVVTIKISVTPHLEDPDDVLVESVTEYLSRFAADQTRPGIPCLISWPT